MFTHPSIGYVRMVVRWGFGYACFLLFIVGCGSAPLLPYGDSSATASTPIPLTTTQAQSASQPSVIPGAATLTTTSTTERKPFTSKRFGYLMTYPADWVVVELKGEWRKGTVLYPGDPGSDLFASSTFGGNLRRVIVGAQARERDMTLDEWVATTKEVVRTHFFECGAPITTEARKLGDAPAQLITYHCYIDQKNQINLYVLAQHGERNYLVYWVSLSGNEATDRAMFEQFLETFVFTE